MSIENKEKNIVTRIRELETDVAGVTSNFLIASDESIPVRERLFFAREFMEKLPMIVFFSDYDEETIELYKEAETYLVKNLFKY